MADDEMVEKQEAPKLDQLGVTGLQRYGQRGLVYEEFLPELAPYQARRVYREMRDNDPVIGAFLFAIEMILRRVPWHVDGKKQELVDFIEECRIDMSHTWEDFISEVLSMLVFGYSYHEIVYKRRIGPDQKDSTKRSRYTDGKIGWRKLPIRSQDTLLMWEFDEDGGVSAFIQLAPPTYVTTTIPIERSLLFRTTSHKGNPEGRSLLRNAYRPWYFKKRIEEIEGIGVERDLAGLPVFYRTAEVAKVYDTDLRKILRNVRRDEQEGLLLPLIRDEQGNKDLEFSLLSSGGTRQFDTTGIIHRYNSVIAMTVLADFLMLGQGKVGSFALASVKTDLFTLALEAILDAAASVLNRYAIPRLLSINGFKVEETPELKPGSVERPDLEKLANFISKLAAAGMPLFPDDELENYVRTSAKLPNKPEEGASTAFDQAAQRGEFEPKVPSEAPPAPPVPPVPPEASGKNPAPKGTDDVKGAPAK